MALKVKNIACRDGVYYYVRRVPKSVLAKPDEHMRHFSGQTIVRVSLKTKNQAEAIVRAAEARDDFDRRVREALDPGHRTASPLPIARSVTADILEKISRHRRSKIAQEFAQYALLRELGGDAKDYADAMVERFEWEAEHLRRSLIDDVQSDDPRYDLSTMADAVIRDERLHAPHGSPAYAAIRRAIREGELQGYRDATDVLNGERSVLSLRDKSHTSRAPLLSATIDKHIQSQSKSRTIGAINTAAKKFIALIGDMPLDELLPEHFHRFCTHEASRDVGGQSKGSVKRPISADTIQKDIRLLSGAIGRAIKRGEFAGPNPASRIDASAFTRPVSAAIMPAKRPFLIDELNRVFAYPWFTGCASRTSIHKPGTYRLTDAFYWGPILALMTGCRAGELGGLALDEVKTDRPFPHIVIRDNAFRTTKGSYRRRVPLTDQLIEMGFIDFVEHRRRTQGVRLFDDWTAPQGRKPADDPAWSNGKMVRAFNATLIPNALADSLLPEARREVTFHSFRGAFKSLLSMNRYRIPINYVHEVVGHAKSSLDQRYIKEIPLEETYAAIRACRYEGLKIPTPPN